MTFAITDEGYRPVDDAGNVYPSGTLTFYEVGATSVLVTVYSDQALSVSLGSTVTASGGGLFSPMFVNEEVRAVLKNAAGTVQYERDIYSPLGTGSVGTAQIAAGAVTLPKLLTLDDGKIIIGATTANAQVTPSGDVTISNTGVLTIGALKIETGMLEADVVETAKILDANVTKAKLAANIATLMPVLLSTTTPTAAAYVTLDLSAHSGVYTDFFIKIRGVQPASASQFRCQFGHSSGSWWTNGSDYESVTMDNANSFVKDDDTPAMRMCGTLNVDIAGGSAYSGDVKLIDFDNEETPYTMQADGQFNPTTGVAVVNQAMGVFHRDQTDTVTYPKADAIRFGWVASSFGDTNFAAVGSIELYGIV